MIFNAFLSAQSKVKKVKTPKIYKYESRKSFFYATKRLNSSRHSEKVLNVKETRNTHSSSKRASLMTSIEWW